MLYLNTEATGQLTLSDALGRVVKSVESKGAIIPVNDLQAGLYIVRMISGNEVMTQKVLIQ